MRRRAYPWRRQRTLRRRRTLPRQRRKLRRLRRALRGGNCRRTERLQLTAGASLVVRRAEGEGAAVARLNQLDRTTAVGREAGRLTGLSVAYSLADQGARVRQPGGQPARDVGAHGGVKAKSVPAASGRSCDASACWRAPRDETVCGRRCSSRSLLSAVTACVPRVGLRRRFRQPPIERLSHCYRFNAQLSAIAEANQGGRLGWEGGRSVWSAS